MAAPTTAWHPAARTRYFHQGDIVRLAGERGSSYRILRFREERGVAVVELYGSKKRGGAEMMRTVPATRLRRT